MSSPWPDPTGARAAREPLGTEEPTEFGILSRVESEPGGEVSGHLALDSSASGAQESARPRIKARSLEAARPAAASRMRAPSSRGTDRS